MRLLTLLLGCLLISTPLFAQLPSYVPTDGLVAWFPLDGDASDVGPNNIGHDYFSATATTNRLGEAGSALLFNGTNDWIQGDSELFPQDDRTIAFWAKFLQNGTELWMTGYGGGPIGYSTIIYANSSQCNVFNALGHSEHGCQGTFQVPYSSIPDDQWVHIAMTSNPNTARFYINGVEQSSRAGLGEVITSGAHYYIGASPSYNGVDNLSTGSFTGSMDDIGFWNRALTPAEILALATADAILGCTDASACNYDSNANLDDGSCATPACDDPQACNYEANSICGGGDCSYCPQLPADIPTDGLVAWFPLDGDASDVGPNNIGHDYFSATATTNRFGEAASALLFNGTNDWIQGDSELFPQDDRTIAFWAKFLQNGTELWMTGYGGGPIGYSTIIYANSSQCNVFNALGHSEHGCQGTFQVPYSSIPDDQWVHIAMTSNPSTARFYINGVEQSSRAGLGEVITSGAHYYIGASPSYNGVDILSTGSFTGSMDDIGFWNRALTPAEILALASLVPIPGCTDATACNYNPNATQYDGSCDYCNCLQPPTAVAGFGTNYLLASDGILTGWGANNMDQTTIPTDLPRIIKADAAEEYVIWLDEDQNVTIQGGNGPYSNSVPAGLQGIDVAAGRHHMVVVKTDGSLLSLGANYTGLQNEPVVNNAIQGAAGWYHNAAVLDDGTVVGWGDNWAAPANPVTNAVAIDAGVDHTLVLKDDFTIEEWGNNINSSSAWSGLTNVVDIAAGGHGSLAIMSDGSMRAWSATDGSIIYESEPGDFVLDADIDWGSMIVMFEDGSLETSLTPPSGASAFSENWDGCGLCPSDADNDGICNAQDDACYINANLPVFSGISVMSGASGLDAADALLALDLSGGNPVSLLLTGLNGAASLTLQLPDGLDEVPSGFYTATVLDASGCPAVGSAPGGSTEGVEPVDFIVVVPYDQCCGSCGVYDTDLDGICDDIDNCTDRTAPNFNDPANTICGCSDPVEYQGYSYDVVPVGDQCWFAENLRIESYRNGDPIPQYEVDGDWASAHQASEGAWCHPNGDASKSSSYGHLYNHWLIMDGREVCPNGWHVPSDAEFIDLEMFMGMSLETALQTDWRGTDQGTRLKASPSSIVPWDGTDEVGFRWVQGGWRHVSGSYGYVDDLGLLMFSPSAESGSATYGIRQAGNQFQPGGLVRSFGGNAGDGRSLRCVKN